MVQFIGGGGQLSFDGLEHAQHRKFWECGVQVEDGGRTVQPTGGASGVSFAVVPISSLN